MCVYVYIYIYIYMAILPVFPRIKRELAELLESDGLTCVEEFYIYVCVYIYVHIISFPCSRLFCNRIKRELAELLERDGFTSVEEAVGVDSPLKQKFRGRSWFFDK